MWTPQFREGPRALSHRPGEEPAREGQRRPGALGLEDYVGSTAVRRIRGAWWREPPGPSGGSHRSRCQTHARSRGLWCRRRGKRKQERQRGWVGTGGVDTERTLSPQETADPPSRRGGPRTPGSSPGACGAWEWPEGRLSPTPRSTARCASPATASLSIHALLSFLSSPLPLSFFLLTALEDAGGTGGEHAWRLHTHLPLPPPHRGPEASLRPSLVLTFPVYSV